MKKHPIEGCPGLKPEQILYRVENPRRDFLRTMPRHWELITIGKNPNLVPRALPFEGTSGLLKAFHEFFLFHKKMISLSFDDAKVTKMFQTTK